MHLKSCIFPAPPRLEKDLRDQQIEAGDAFKLKIPFSGDGPFEVKVKKDNRDIPDNDRIRISVFDDFATIAIKGELCRGERERERERERNGERERERERERNGEREKCIRVNRKQLTILGEIHERDQFSPKIGL